MRKSVALFAFGVLMAIGIADVAKLSPDFAQLFGALLTAEAIVIALISMGIDDE